MNIARTAKLKVTVPWKHLALVLCIAVVGILLYTLSGGLPARTWLQLFQVSPLIGSLLNKQGVGVLLPFAILVLQSLALFAAWILLLWLAIREGYVVYRLLVVQPRIGQPTAHVKPLAMAVSPKPVTTEAVRMAQTSTLDVSQGVPSFLSPARIKGNAPSHTDTSPFLLAQTAASTTEVHVKPPEQQAAVPAQEFIDLSPDSSLSEEIYTLGNPFEGTGHSSANLQEYDPLASPFEDTPPMPDISDANMYVLGNPFEETNAQLAILQENEQLLTSLDDEALNSSQTDEVYVFGNPFEGALLQTPARLHDTVPLHDADVVLHELPLDDTPNMLEINEPPIVVPETPPIASSPIATVPSEQGTTSPQVVPEAQEEAPPLSKFEMLLAELRGGDTHRPTMEPFIVSTPLVTQTPLLVDFNTSLLRAGGVTHPGVARANKPNEDAFSSTTFMRTPLFGGTHPVGLYLVADGMGGHAGGAYASSFVIAHIRSVLEPILRDPHARSSKLKDAFVDAIEEANILLFESNSEARQFRGTTLTGVIVVEQSIDAEEKGHVPLEAHIVNVGDSRTYSYSTLQGLTRITRDHSVVEGLIEQGVIQPEERYTDQRRNEIYRCLGEKASVEVDTFTFPFQAQDRLLLCSDGLWEMVQDTTLATLLSTPVKNPSQIASLFVEAALEGGGKDNVTALVVLHD